MKSARKPSSAYEASLRLQHISEWRLIYTALTLIHFGSKGLLVSVVGTVLFGVPLLYLVGLGILFVPLGVAMASLLISFLGFCLCWNPPKYSGLRTTSRGFIVVMIITAICVSGGAITLLQFDNQEVAEIVFYSFFTVACLGTYCAAIQWSLFLQGIANEFQESDLAVFISKYVKVFLISALFVIPLIHEQQVAAQVIFMIIINLSGFLLQYLILHQVRRRMKEGLAHDLVSRERQRPEQSAV